MGVYPENAKLDEISDKSQEIGEFLEWLRSGDYESREDLGGIELACHRMRGRSCRREAELSPTRVPVNDLLAAYFEIDQDKIEAEKRAMIDEFAKSYEEAA